MRSALLGLLLIWAPMLALSAPVRFSSIEASEQHGSAEDLNKVIDGIDAGSAGWTLNRELQEAQVLVCRAEKPVRGRRLRISLCFLSGFSNAHFNEFTLSVTSDPNVNFESEWEPISPQWFYSTATNLELVDRVRLRSSGTALNTIFVIETLAPSRAVTGFRIELAPTAPIGGTPVQPPKRRNDFVLTEFRAEAFEAETTNIALGTAIRASHQLWGSFRAENLVDGQPATFAHPRDPALGEAFYFEIDFGRVRAFDHFALRNRGDGLVPERLSRLELKLYDSPPESGAAPHWEAMDRKDGSYPQSGAVDIVRGSLGEGQFSGRYLRISSRSPVANSPQLAELEAYEPIVPTLVNARADNVTLAPDRPATVAAGTRWLAFGLRLPPGVPDLQLRWRLTNFHSDWQSVSRDGIAEGACPPAGSYEFEAQSAHTDGQWNEATLRWPVTVLAPIWLQPRFQFGGASIVLLGGLWLARHSARRRLARRIADLEREHALDAERARIARDMHDVVGARLTQLSLMHDLFAAEHNLSAAAGDGLRRLTGTARESVAALDEVVWAINSRNDTLGNVADYLCHCASEYLTPLGIRCRQVVPTDWPEHSVGAQPRHQLLLAFKEALQNIAKHAAASEVTLTLKFEAPTLVVLLADNGCGLPSDPSGLEKDGLENMSARLSKFGGSCAVRPGPVGGTEVEMHLPL